MKNFNREIKFRAWISEPKNLSPMKKINILKMQEDNWKEINDLMELRQKLFEDSYEENWWNYLIEDEMYKFLCQELVEIKSMGRPIFLIKKELSKKDIKSLASGLLSVKDYMKNIEPIL